MSARSRGAFFALVMGTAALAAQLATPTTKIADAGERLNLEQLFPVASDGWRIDHSLPIILPSPDVQAKLDRIYNQVLTRTYVDMDGYRVMLSVAYGGDQSDGTSAHKPEVCYPAQGFEMRSNRRRSLDVRGQQLGVRQLVAQSGSRIEPITYWIVTGDQVVTSATEQKLAQIKFGMRGLIPDGMLIRVSSVDREVERAFGVQHRFIDSILTTMDGKQRARIAAMP